MPPSTRSGRVIPATQQLPPLILHPFADQSGTAQLVEKARKAPWCLRPAAGKRAHRRRTLRACSARALPRDPYALLPGKDLFRWIEQCVDSVGAAHNREDQGLREQSFAQLLVRYPPRTVRDKLAAWGVTDFRGHLRARAGSDHILPASRRSSSSFGRDFLLELPPLRGFLSRATSS